MDKIGMVEGKISDYGLQDNDIICFQLAVDYDAELETFVLTIIFQTLKSPLCNTNNLAHHK